MSGLLHRSMCQGSPGTIPRLCVFLVCGLLILAAWGIQPAAAQSDPKYDRLLAELRKLGETPCTTRLRFVKVAGAAWFLTCPDCSVIPASRVYPQAILNVVEQWAINRSLTMTDLLRVTGEC